MVGDQLDREGSPHVACLILAVQQHDSGAFPPDDLRLFSCSAMCTLLHIGVLDDRNRRKHQYRTKRYREPDEQIVFPRGADELIRAHTRRWELWVQFCERGPTLRI
jgi:hypothetical protein